MDQGIPARPRWRFATILGSFRDMPREVQMGVFFGTLTTLLQILSNVAMITGMHGRG
jgi:hypothetical protein